MAWLLIGQDRHPFGTKSDAIYLIIEGRYSDFMIFMASTGISAEKTAGEISQILSRSGLVKYIQFEYDNGDISGVSFIIMNGETRVPFRLPARVDAMLTAMKNDRKTPRHLCNLDQARRVEWRQLLRWVEAQMARVETGSADMKEIFFPYLIGTGGKTLYEIAEQNQFLIEYKEE